MLDINYIRCKFGKIPTKSLHGVKFTNFRGACMDERTTPKNKHPMVAEKQYVTILTL